MTEAVNYLFCAHVETYSADLNSEEERPVLDEKTSFLAKAVIDSLGQVIEFYKELSNTGFLMRDNFILTQEGASFKNKGSIRAEERVSINCKEIESSGRIEAKSVEFKADRVSLLGEGVSIKADQLVIHAREVVVDGAHIEAELTLEQCERLELRHLSDDLLAVWQAAAPASCDVVVIELSNQEEAELEGTDAQEEGLASDSEGLASGDEGVAVDSSETEEPVLADDAGVVVEASETEESVSADDAAVVVEASETEESVSADDAAVVVEASETEEPVSADDAAVVVEESQSDEAELTSKKELIKGFFGL